MKPVFGLIAIVPMLASSARGFEERKPESGETAEADDIGGGIALSDVLSSSDGPAGRDHSSGDAFFLPAKLSWVDRAQPVTKSPGGPGEFKPSWRQFRGDVGQSFRSFFSWNNVFPAVVIGAGTGISSIADHRAQEYFVATERLGAASKVLSNPALLTAGFGTMMAVGWFRGNEKSRRATYDLALGLIVDNTVTFGTKVAVRRRRPDGGNFSFPSGHASNLFTIAAILGHHYGPKVSIPLHALAAFVSVSRMDVNSHWLSDTVAGAGLGLVIGHSILRYRDSSDANRLTWIPLLAPGRVGVLLVVHPR